jgi:hypothetical protein
VYTYIYICIYIYIYVYIYTYIHIHIRIYIVDDKGCVLIACWGVPLASHHDNTRRALIAGSKISESLSMIDMETSIGITTGFVFCGTVGSFVRRYIYMTHIPMYTDTSIPMYIYINIVVYV